jgi:acyl carrier protein
VTTKTDIRGTIVAALVAESEADRAPADVTDDVTLDGEGLALNSLGFVRAMVDLEDRFDVELQDAVVMSSDFTTVGDVIQFVRKEIDNDGGGG